MASVQETVEASSSILLDPGVGEESATGPFEGPEKLLEIWFAPEPEYISGHEFNNKGTRRRENAPVDERLEGLRTVARSVWEDMLDEVQCKVLSVIEGDEVDAYLLSESSMFVWPHKLILKTCGTTTLLLGLPTLLKVAREICDFHGVWRCFYSRKSFMFPERQRGPHRDWQDEMKFLDALFENSSAYTVGKMNGDHWLLYLTPPQDDVLLSNVVPAAAALVSSISPDLSQSPLEALVRSMPRSAPRPHPPRRTLSSANLMSSKSSLSSGEKRKSPPDQTLEILMSKLSPEACKAFYYPSSEEPFAEGSGSSPCHDLGASLAKRLGFTSLLPDATFDSYLFEPCGFSLNAVDEDRYATVHVTPEEGWSYASFECNLDLSAPSSRRGSKATTPRPTGLGKLPTFTPSVLENGLQSLKLDGAAARSSTEGPTSLPDLITRVLDIFKPEKLSITLFVSVEDEEGEDGEEGERQNDANERTIQQFLRSELLTGNVRYDRTDKIVYEFSGYKLIYITLQARPVR